MWVQRTPAPGALIAPSEPTRATLQDLPDGPEGTGVTLRSMRDYVRAAVRSPGQQIREAALTILQSVPQRRWMREVLALHAYVRDQIRYVRHPLGVQIVQEPEKTLEYGQGNCVDKAVLLASMLESTGHPTRLVALVIRGQQDDQFSHVLVETKVGREWIPLETIIPVRAGWYPPEAGARLVLPVS